MVKSDGKNNSSGSVRKRTLPSDISKEAITSIHSVPNLPKPRGAGLAKPVDLDVPPLPTGTYWLTRIVLLRYTAFIYFVAFLVALHQNGALLGSQGLLPVNLYLQQVKRHVGTDELHNLLTTTPTLLWLVDPNQLDAALDVVAYTGLALSAFVLVFGAANWFFMLALWALYHSLVNVGQRWYSFGWESQLLEMGFLATFLCPVWSLSSMPKHTPTPMVVIYAFRWFIFRIMLGAGLIKIRGDKCWRDLTCMNYHYETQPVPNPMSYLMHQSPEIFHKFETLTNHFVELIAPFFLFFPRRLRLVGGVIQIFFQVVLIISGNLSFLNWLTIVPSLASFDDVSLQWIFSQKRCHQVACLQAERKSYRPTVGVYIRRAFNLSLAALLVYLSIPVVQNLLSSRQAMNTSFEPFRLVNTYGAFGSVTKKRTEVIFQGTHHADPQSTKAVWLEYEFKCKPGNVSRAPCLISPYHYRLDWLLWFAAFQNYQQNPWLVHLAAKLLVNDKGVEGLMAYNPFHSTDPPKFVRVEHYKYQFTRLGSGSPDWWKRKHIGSYLPPVSLSQLDPFLRQMNWK